MKRLIFLVSGLLVASAIYIIYYSTSPLPVYIAEKMEELGYSEVKVRPLLFLGDIMLGRYVEVLQNKEGLDPFGDTTDFLKSHTTIANLEGPIPKVHKPTPISGFAFSFPSSTPKFLVDHGVSIVSLSNNHALDQGLDGYKDTKLLLDKVGVSHFGGYGNKESDYVETKLGDTPVIIFGINMISNTWDEQSILATTKFLHENHPQALLIAYIHWGNEYDDKQGEVQQIFAHKLIDKGVNVIIGSHPHVVEGIEVYKNSPIFYSLGNFIFDQYFSEETQEGFMVSIDKQNNKYIFSLTPIVGKRSKTNIADDIFSNKIRARILKSSSPDLQKSIQEGRIILPIL